MSGRLRQGARGSFAVLGPAPAPLAKLRGEYRAQIFLKARHRTAMRGCAACGAGVAAGIAAARDRRRRSDGDAVADRSATSARGPASSMGAGVKHSTNITSANTASQSRVRSSGTSSSSTRGWRGPTTKSIATSSDRPDEPTRETVVNDQGHAQRGVGDASGSRAEDGVRDVAAIELGDWKQVQRRGQQAEPGGKRHRMHVDGETGRRGAPHQPRCSLEQQRLAKLQAREMPRQLEPGSTARVPQRAPALRRGSRRSDPRCRCRRARASTELARGYESPRRTCRSAPPASA